MSVNVTRRNFLRATGFITTSIATFGLGGCLGSSGGGSADRHKFPQSVAAADPRPDSVVLWTRILAQGADDIAVASSGDIDAQLLLSSDPANAALLGGNQALQGKEIATVSVTAQQRYDHTIRHKLGGLSPATTYYYQFRVDGSRSRVGRFRTAPASDAAIGQLKFGLLVCQDWSVNHWAGFDDLLARDDDLDFFIHLGDYIYETVGAAFQSGSVESRHSALVFPDGTANADGSSYATSLDDYRYLYKRYRSDPRLQAVHERYAMIAIWDDHEFSDDCWGDAVTYDNGSYDPASGAGDNSHATTRRRAANQAWFEYMPADVSFDDSVAGFATIRLYRDFRFGTLAHLLMTDERLYRSDHLIPEAAPNPATGNAIGSLGSRYMVPEALLYDQVEAAKIAAGTALGDPLALVSMLGATQRDWWKTTLGNASTTWKLWGSEVMLLKLGLDGTRAIAALIALQAVPTVGAATAFGVIMPDIVANGVNSAYIPAADKAALAPYFQKFVLNADMWDGYDAERRELMNFIAGHNIANVVALTGDIHAFYAGEVRDNYRAVSGGNPVMNEIVVAGVSSDSFFSYLKSAVAALSSDLATLVYYPISNLPVPGVGTISFDVNLLDYTLGRPAPTLADLQQQVRHPVRSALAQKDIPEAQLDATTDAVVNALAADPAFNTKLLGLAQTLAGLDGNPWLEHIDSDAQGYGVVTLTPGELVCHLRKMHRLIGSAAPNGPVVASETTIRIAAGSPQVNVG
ncbi:alkaline phosphatase [Azonexus sp.]|uniref:alkaline phosphatase D family protein n=1 Tax=Azonexus sp. TaxID=1872668 RepID=UPI0035B0823A